MQRVAQLDGRAGELAQHQDAVFVVARREVLLGHQVHAVVQRGHEAQIGGAVPAIHLFVVALTFDQDDRSPQAMSESAG